MTPDRGPLLVIVDDDPDMCRMLERYGQKLGYRVESYHGGAQIMAALSGTHVDVALVDLQMPDVGGLDVLRAIRAADADCQVILMTGHTTIDTAIEAVKLGALDYLSKPLPFDRLKELLDRARANIERRRALLEADHASARRLELCGMIGRSAPMQELFELLRRLSPYVRVALVTGETGTGKELVARALHQLGPRSRKKFVTINCSAVVESLFESELFGHMRGAFTGATENKIGLFESADGGTLFLDEVGELPLAVQAKLLRVLEAGEVHRVGSLEPRKVDVHVIAATNRNLDEEVAAGRFRLDLLYRLNVVQIGIPPLRDHREDIPYLTAAFVAACKERFQGKVTGLSVAAESLLRDYPWPGNVRELRNVIERACMLADGHLLTDRDVSRALPHREASPASLAPQPLVDREPRPAPAKPVTLEDVQRTLQQTGGNRAATARTLGITRRTLYRRLDEFGLR